MSTLPNVETHQDPCIKPALDAIPEAKSSTTGVSVRYVHASDMRWYVFRASYGREDRAADIIVAYGTYAYVAKRYTRKIVDGKPKRVLENLIPNLMFAYTTSENADRYIKGTPELSFLSYYYNHFEHSEGTKNPPLTIPNRELESFILATCGHDEHLLVVSRERCHFRSGELVRVTEGAFRGVEGRVTRVAGQQRVVVNLDNIGFVSTAYIPSAFIQKIGIEA